MATPRGPKTSPHHACLLQVTLEGIDPPIWRWVWVESDMSLHALHHILQAAMGWTGAHLHEFTIDGRHYGIPHPDDLREVPVQDERKVKLGSLLKKGLSFSYLYDFGDSWNHLIGVKKVETKDEPYGAAFVEAGEGACPPEDSGGIPGYQDFLELYQTKPKSKDVREFLRWAGEDFNPFLFDRHATNAALLRLGWNQWGK
ncbi:plasmid pRiA4b ORF-3 family protein [Acidithiobacillus ferrooxidans F221]|uniref:plasmid pRiA4b ORF-3 family protein n=1 Tax=Acidithiobacillus ferrooxidans TaxID=920 RepID=UPI001C0654B5|nr:plasmid pRiA4b ORF-3 family protein [Acidithiobacillus ferrooxidans]MBU2807239.1 plasmid pRiA4b ORF-3 family protein [Acidithiobacillus ferrooxidans F221]